MSARFNIDANGLLCGRFGALQDAAHARHMARSAMPRTSRSIWKTVARSCVHRARYSAAPVLP